MPFILRVDIDKPYGHHSLFKKVLSKIREDFYFPALDNLGYLRPTIELLNFCNYYDIPAFWYFRNCTVPNAHVKELICEGGHILGFHAENTRTKDTFVLELQTFEKRLGQKVYFFTKHGSGKFKLGRLHYPPYEPEKYKAWANQLEMDFSFGNGIAKSFSDLESDCQFYENMFWLESNYRDKRFNSIDALIDHAKKNVIVLIVHPANYFTDRNVREDLKKIILLSKQNSIEWIKEIRH